jgi:hypothetical protein
MRSTPRLRAPALSSVARCSPLRRASSPMRWLSSSQRSTCSVLRRSEALGPFVPLVAGDVLGVGEVVALAGIVVVVSLEGLTAAISLAAVVAVVVLARVGTLARLGMPAEFSGLPPPSEPPELLAVGHAGSTGRELDMLMDARTCADEANTISAATLATVILFIVRPRMDDAPT